MSRRKNAFTYPQAAAVPLLQAIAARIAEHPEEADLWREEACAKLPGWCGNACDDDVACRPPGQAVA